jgi:hypothetical protein
MAAASRMAKQSADEPAHWNPPRRPVRLERRAQLLAPAWANFNGQAAARACSSSLSIQSTA